MKTHRHLSKPALRFALLIFLCVCFLFQAAFSQGFDRSYKVPVFPTYPFMGGLAQLNNGKALIFSSRSTVIKADVNGDSLGIDSLPITNTEGFRKVTEAGNGEFLALSLVNDPNWNYQFTRFDSLGNLMGSDTLPLGGKYWGTDLVVDANQNIYVIGYKENTTPGNETDYYLISLDSSLNIRWTMHNTQDSQDVGYAIELAANGEIITMSKRNIPGAIEMVVRRVTQNGVLVWEQIISGHYPHFSPKEVFENDLGEISFTFLGMDSTFTDTALTLVVLEGNGTQKFITRFSSPFLLDFGGAFTPAPDGGYLLTGTVRNTQSIGGAQYDRLFIKTDSLGSVEWEKLWVTPLSESIEDIQCGKDGFYYAAGLSWNDPIGVYGLFYLKIDSIGNVYTRYIRGNVFADFNRNCQLDSNDFSQDGWLVRANGPLDFYAYSDSVGNYTIDVESGTYAIEIQPLGPYWEIPTCAIGGLLVTLNQPYDTVTRDLPVSPFVNCPYMVVDIAAPFVRHCFPNTYTVRYENVGTTPAYPTRIEVLIDTAMVVDSASLPWITPQQGNLYVFDLDTVDIGESGGFRIFTRIPCPGVAVAGQTYCAEAYIYPDSLCQMPESIWDGSSITIEARCYQGDSIEFVIRNVGTSNMANPGGYAVVEDNLLRLQSSFMLTAGDSIVLHYPANGSTWTLQADQSPGHPGNSYPIISAEGCGINSLGDFSLGYVTTFPEDDGDPFKSIFCEESRASLDPNDKTGYPIGTGTEHYILDNQRLEYRIRFQNTGNDTAFTVVIRDTLSSRLDPSTLRLGAASHPYTFDIDGDGNMAWTFHPIALPDSNVNEPESHGFVFFSIAPDTGLAPGTRIENTAFIYFDFNAAVVTNTTFHTLNETFIVGMDPIHRPQYPSVRIYPHPLQDKATLDLGETFQQVTLNIYDLQGRLLRTEHHRAVSEFEIEKGSLPQGLFVYRLTLNGVAAFSGKIMIRE